MMGCRSTKGANVTDPTTGLTPNDVKLIRKSWGTLDRNKLMIPMGAELFVTLFDQYPYMMDFFGPFHLQVASLRTNHALGRHALTFMNGINMYVDYIDTPEPLNGLLQMVALSHLERGITTVDMDRMALVFVATLRSQVGGTFTEEYARSWKKFFRFVNQVYENVELQVNGIIEKRSQMSISKTSVYQ